MKNRIKISILSTIFLYLLVSFVKWDLFFILQISKYSYAERSGIIFFMALKEFITEIIILLNKLK